MAIVITIADVKDFCLEASSLSDSTIQIYIEMVNQADVCLDLNLVADRLSPSEIWTAQA